MDDQHNDAHLQGQCDGVLKLPANPFSMPCHESIQIGRQRQASGDRQYHAEPMCICQGLWDNECHPHGLPTP